MKQESLSGIVGLHLKSLNEILTVPARVESVYSLTQHVWAGEGDEERRESKKQNRVRLETLDEFFIDPVRSYLHRILEPIADGKGQGFWVQAEFGVGKSHLLAASAVIAVGGRPAWDKIAARETAEGKAGPGARLDHAWRKRIEKKRIFPVVFSLEGCGGAQVKRLEDFVLEEAQVTFAVREGKPLAIYPEEHLARKFMEEDRKRLKDEVLRSFLADDRLMKGLPSYDYKELLEGLQDPAAQRDAGRVLMAFYRHMKWTPGIPTERGERLRHAVRDILESGYDGVFIAIDEMSEYLRRSQFTADDEDCLLALSSTLAKSDGLPIWTIVAAQSSHTNPKKIIGPDRLREELLQHKAERFRNIVVQRTRTIKDPTAVEAYRKAYSNYIPWVKEAASETFADSFPFTPDAIDILRSISTRLTGTRSTISFLHRALRVAVEKKECTLVPLWRVLDDLLSYNETPSTSSSGAISIRSAFRNQVAALEAAQNTLKRITDGQLARPQNKSRAERILSTLFLYHLAGVASGLTVDQILDAVCDIKPNEETVEAQRGHYETLLDEMGAKLRNQVRKRDGRYEFIPKESGEYDSLYEEALRRLKADPELFRCMLDRLLAYADPVDPSVRSPFADFVAAQDWQRVQVVVKSWHGQERTGQVAAADLTSGPLTRVEVEGETDFLVVLSRRPMPEKAVDALLRKGDAVTDPRVVLWARADFSDPERDTLAGVLAHLLVADEHRDTPFAKDGLREFRKDATRAFTVLAGSYARGVAKTSRTSLDTALVGGVPGALEKMACAAMDTCYESRDLDFGSRRFDTQAAVKLINGLVRLGQAVSEGDNLWSAVENFAPPLSIVRPEAPKYLDPEESRYYKRIRDRIVKFGRTGLEVRTVYNWFTGYHAEDGTESPGLTRRMVDVYLLCMARKGVLRINQKKGGWIDRNTIATIDFKPDVLRGLERVDLPRPLENWNRFYRYTEILLSRREGSLGPVPEGSLGPAFDRAKAEESLQSLWEGYWIRGDDIEQTSGQLDGLFRDLEEGNPFDELLLFWLKFAQEARPEPFDLDEVYNALSRAVLSVAEVTAVEDLKPEHADNFKKRFAELAELRGSFDKTRKTLLQAAKLASAPVSEDRDKVISAQTAVRKELQAAGEMVLHADAVTTRLCPRLEQLEEVFVREYMNALGELERHQKALGEAAGAVAAGDELLTLKDFAGELDVAATAVTEVETELASLPPALPLAKADRKAREKVLRQDADLTLSDHSRLTFKRLDEENACREEALRSTRAAGEKALARLSTFLRSPSVLQALRDVKENLPGLNEIRESGSPDDVSAALVALAPDARHKLAKRLKVALKGKQMKVVRLGEFAPQTRVLLEQQDIAVAVLEYKSYLESEWEDGKYLGLE